MSKPPFFILGSQRSGTTMLRLMLNGHPNLAIPHETGFITPFLKSLGEYGDLGVKENRERILDDICRHKLVVRGDLIPDKGRILAHEPSTYRDLVSAVLEDFAERQGKTRWGDKTPYYTPDVDVLRGLYPDAQIIHIVRDGRDVAVSQKTIEWMSNNFPSLARDWAWKTTLLHKVGACIAPDYLEIRYEDLVLEPEATLRTVCAFLGESYTERMLDYPEYAGSLVPAESLKWHSNSVSAPDPSKLGTWKTKLSPGEKMIFDEIAGETLSLFGYERESVPRSWRTQASKLYYALVARY